MQINPILRIHIDELSDLLEEYKKYNKYADNKQLTWYRN
jgi:hypothetical protein